eukprot:15365446-Ditylum_brightwellii.AAC.2
MQAMDVLNTCEESDVNDVPYTRDRVQRTVIKSTWAFKTMVRTIMTLAVTLGLKSRQVDYTNAFVQASLLLNEEVNMSYPQGWEKKNKVLQLMSSVYGLSQVQLTWFNKLSQGLKYARFKPSTLDPCLFFSND